MKLQIDFSSLALKNLKELEKKNISVEVPLMPEPWNPRYVGWKSKFDQLDINENTVLIGHSCGCAFLVRWLGDFGKKIDKLILVASWKIPSKEFSEGENEMYDYDITGKAKENAGRVVIFTSDDEEEDGKKSAKIFSDSLGGKIIELRGKGHFLLGDMGTEEFPELLEEVLR